MNAWKGIQSNDLDTLTKPRTLFMFFAVRNFSPKKLKMYTRRKYLNYFVQ